ncbi:MAG: hypothetical protein Tsb0013_15540 [Phycisphaerales bacterium]
MMSGVRTRTMTILCALACAGTLVGGCASSGSTGSDQTAEAFAQQRAERLARAQRLAERAESTDDLEKKLEHLREAVRLFDQHSAYWNNLGQALAESDDYASAGEAFALAAQLDPTDPRPPYNHGALYVRRYYYQEALPFFERALERDPNYLNAIRGMIHTRVVLREFDEDLVDLLNRAVILEHDERWLAYFQRQRVAVRAELDRLEEVGGDAGA